MEYLTWNQEGQELLSTQKIDWSQVKVQELKFVQEVDPNQEVETQVHIYFPTTKCDFVRLVIQVRITGMGIKTDSKMLLKSGSKKGVNIASENWTGSQIWESGAHSFLSSIS